MWDFDVKHMPSRKNVVANSLSRRPANKDGSLGATEDLDDYVDEQLGIFCIRVIPLELDDKVRVLDNTYSEKSEELVRWLTTI